MLIIGHRGARNEAPENTLAGFLHLQSIGIHRVELDVRLSLDDELVVIHDSSVNRTTQFQGQVRELSAAQLKAMDASINFPSSEFSHIPTLEQVFSCWPELAYIQLEVKTADTQTLKILTHKLAQLVEEKNLHSVAVVTSSDQKVLAMMHDTAPSIHRGYVAERFTRNPVDVCVNHDCSHLVVNHHRCTPGLIAQARTNDLIVSVWTVNQFNIAKKLFHWGVDSIISDVPSMMLKQFGKA